MTVAEVQPEALTVDELRAAIASFDAATLLRLEGAAKYLTDGRGIEPDDLLQDAIEACLAGDRNCPRDVAVHTFVFNTMRSRASSALKTKRRSKIDGTIDLYDEENAVADALAPTAEQHLLSLAEQNEIINAIDDLLKDDPETQLVAAGLCQEMTREEIQKDCTLSDTEYETIRKRMRRKLNKRFPKGWRP